MQKAISLVELNVEQVEALPADMAWNDWASIMEMSAQQLEFQGRLPQGTAKALRADMYAHENGKQKVLVAQLSPQNQQIARFVWTEVRARPENCGGEPGDYQDCPSPVDL